MATDDADDDRNEKTGATDENGRSDWNVDTDDGEQSDWNEDIGTEEGIDWKGEFDELFPKDDKATLERVRRVSNLLDEAITVPGTNYRIGLDPLVGILPVAGDSVTTVISLYIIGEAARAGVSRSTLATMLGLVAVDAVVGSIPVLGTIFDAVWKANKWNVGLLERELDAR